MNNVFLLANAEYGDPANRWHWHFGEGLLIPAILCFLLGLLVGYLAWRYCRGEAKRIEAENLRLEEEYKSARRSITGLEDRVNELEVA